MFCFLPSSITKGCGPKHPREPVKALDADLVFVFFTKLHSLDRKGGKTSEVEKQVGLEGLLLLLLQLNS